MDPETRPAVSSGTARSTSPSTSKTRASAAGILFPARGRRRFTLALVVFIIVGENRNVEARKTPHQHKKQNAATQQARVASQCAMLIYRDIVLKTSQKTKGRKAWPQNPQAVVCVCQRKTQETCRSHRVRPRVESWSLDGERHTLHTESTTEPKPAVPVDGPSSVQGISRGAAGPTPAMTCSARQPHPPPHHFTHGNGPRASIFALGIRPARKPCHRCCCLCLCCRRWRRARRSEPQSRPPWRRRPLRRRCLRRRPPRRSPRR